MKSIQSGKTIPNATNIKSKKNSKDREKRKSSSGQDNDKGPPSRVNIYIHFEL